MASTSVGVLHVGAALDITLFEYLFRVVVYLFTFGVVAAAVRCGQEAVGAIRSRVVDGGGRENDT